MNRFARLPRPAAPARASPLTSTSRYGQWVGDSIVHPMDERRGVPRYHRRWVPPIGSVHPPGRCGGSARRRAAASRFAWCPSPPDKRLEQGPPDGAAGTRHEHAWGCRSYAPQGPCSRGYSSCAQPVAVELQLRVRQAPRSHRLRARSPIATRAASLAPQASPRSAGATHQCCAGPFEYPGRPRRRACPRPAPPWRGRPALCPGRAIAEHGVALERDQDPPRCAEKGRHPSGAGPACLVQRARCSGTHIWATRPSPTMSQRMSLRWRRASAALRIAGKSLRVPGCRQTAH